MLYPNLQFPQYKNRPYFYSNFVSTVDGKTQVLSEPYAYWPLGSKTDFETLIQLRAYADVLIHGKNTALWFEHISRFKEEKFKKLRKKVGKEKDLIYMVLSNNPDKKLTEHIKDKNSFLITNETNIPNLPNIPNVLSFGKKEINLKEFSSYLFQKGYRNILVEGGPNLFGSFLKENLIDEVFLTIAPKIFGNENNQTLTMAEGNLFSPKKVKNSKLISVKQVENEVFLRYRIINQL